MVNFANFDVVTKGTANNSNICIVFKYPSQPAFTCSKPTMETPEQCVKFVLEYLNPYNNLVIDSFSFLKSKNSDFREALSHCNIAHDFPLFHGCNIIL